MTEQELITAMNSLTGGAQAVLQAIQNYGSQSSGTVSFTLGGTTYTLKAVQQQITDNAAQQAADRLAFCRNFGGVPTSQTVTRDAYGRIASVTTTLADGYQIIQTPTSNPLTGAMTAVGIVVKDILGATVHTATKTLNYSNGLYMGVSA